jgi:integrase
LGPQGGVIVTKSRGGTRTVPIVAALREHLVLHRAACTWSDDPDALVFGRSPGAASWQASSLRRAGNTWRSAELEPITFHEARHTCASIFIAAGANAKTVSEIVGHASITITFDRYGHLFARSRNEAARLVDEFLARADTASRIGQLEH